MGSLIGMACKRVTLTEAAAHEHKKTRPPQQPGVNGETIPRYRDRRPRMINKAPAKRAIAFAPDAGSISGVVIAAAAMLEAPMQRSDKPAIFIKFLDILFVILRIKMVKLSEYRE